MSRILLTGATGAVGSFLLPLLIEAGHDVFCIVRSKNGKEPNDRIHMKTNGTARRVTILEGDVTEPDAGLSIRDFGSLAGSIDKVVHCAASTKFDAKYSDEIFKVNVGGTRTMLGLASRIGAPEVHHVSTAYVAGDSEVFSDTDCRKGQTLRNPYEESKLAAEELVRQWCGSQGVPYSIYRLSILIGHSVSGITHSFDGYYGFFKSIMATKRFVERKQKKGALPADIRLENGFLYLPLELKCSNTLTLNLIPADWLTDILSQLVNAKATNMTFNLVHPDPPMFRWVVETSLEHLKVRGFYYEPKDSPGEKSTAVRALQAGLDEKLERYRPYITHEPRFISGNIERVLGSQYVKPPRITGELLGRLLDYAASVDWGKDRRQKQHYLS